ncbi:MAG: hypothetical protein IJH37_12865 [Clostridia bacterium]|nr:hypothetical protein [Clostridia bacterium]
MPFAHFSKINKGISWSVIRKNIQLQNLNSCKKIKYKIVSTILLSQSEFNIICNDISVPHRCYEKIVSLSYTDSHGVLGCIVIKNTKDLRKIILYTSGLIYPIYATIEE